MVNSKYVGRQLEWLVTTLSSHYSEGDLNDLLSIPEYFDLGSAHFECSPSEDIIGDQKFSELCSCLDGYKPRSARLKKELRYSMPEVVAKMLREETTLKFNESHITCPLSARTRDVISSALRSFAREDKKMALPLPSWRFWSLNSPRDLPEFIFFEAQTEDQFLQGFEDAVVKKGARATLLSTPSNPLMMSLSDEGAKAANLIARKYGVDVLIDDVLRGTHPPGKRDTLGRHFDSPHIVEGFSKRLGEEPYATFSYLLSPRASDLCPINPVGTLPDLAKGRFLEIGLGKHSDQTYNNLCSRNKLFDIGFTLSSNFHGAASTRYSPASLTTQITLSKDFSLTSDKLVERAERDGIELRAISNFYPPKYKIPSNLQKCVRVAVGNLPWHSLLMAGVCLGNYLAEFRSR